MKMAETIDQAGKEVLDPRNTMEQTLAVELAQAELDRAIMTAHRFPRSVDVAVKRMRTSILYNQDAMENSIYSLPRGGKPILGPSIGFANAVFQAWGNCRVASHVVAVDIKRKVVITEGAFLDLETNAQSIVPVERRIVDKHGRLYSDDMQIVTGAAAASIARRNAILQGTLRIIWHPIYEEALKGVRGNVQTFSEYKERAFTAMAQFGVKPDQIFMALGLKGEADMTFENIPAVRGMYAALRDGSMTVEEMFDPRKQKGTSFATVSDPLGAEASAKMAEGNAAARTAAQAAVGLSEATPAELEEHEEDEAEMDPTAGMGESEESDLQQMPAQASQASHSASPAAQTASSGPSQGGGQNNAPASPAEPATDAIAQRLKEIARDAGAQAPKVAPKAAAPAAEAPKGETGTAALRSPEEYLAYWEGVLAAATSEAAIGNQWSMDRELRTRCRVVQEVFNEAMQMKTARIAQIKLAK